MKANVGTTDARVRLVLGAILLLVAAVMNDVALLALPAAIVGVVSVGTALTRRCLLYVPLGIDTSRGRPTPHAP